MPVHIHAEQIRFGLCAGQRVPQMDGWMDGRMDGRTDGWTDGRRQRLVGCEWGVSGERKVSARK